MRVKHDFCQEVSDGRISESLTNSAGGCGTHQPGGKRRMPRCPHRHTAGAAGLHRRGGGRRGRTAHGVPLRRRAGGPPAGGGPAEPHRADPGDAAGPGVAVPAQRHLFPGVGAEPPGGPAPDGGGGCPGGGRHGGRPPDPDHAARAAGGAVRQTGDRRPGGPEETDRPAASGGLHPQRPSGGRGAVRPPGRHPGRVLAADGKTGTVRVL